MKQENTSTKNKHGIKYQIQSKISASIIVVMALIMFLVVIIVYNLLSHTNNKEVQFESEAVALQVEKFFAPFEKMVEQQAFDNDVIELLSTTGSGQRMNENKIYNTVLDKMVKLQALDSTNIQVTWIADIDSNATITSAGFISDTDYDVTSRAWFDCTKTKKTILTKVYVSAGTGKKILSVATPIYDIGGGMLLAFQVWILSLILS